MRGREIVFYLCLIVVAAALGSAFPFLVPIWMEGSMTEWWLNLAQWQQLALAIPALCLLFCLAYVLLWLRADLKREAQEAQDRRAFVTRFRNGGPDEIDQSR